MKIEKIVLLSVVCILTCIIIRILYLNSDLKTANLKTSKEIQRLEQSIKRQTDKYYLEQLNENLNLNGNLKLKDKNSKTHNINDIVKFPTLVFRYSVFNCNACVNAEINNLKNLNIDPKILSNRIMFIGYYEDLRSEIFAYKSMKLNIPIYILPTNKIGLPIEDKNNIPYYFVLDDKLSVKNFFIPEKENPELTKTYLKIIISRVLQN